MPVRFDEDEDDADAEVVTEVREDDESDNDEEQGEEATFEGTLQRTDASDRIELDDKTNQKIRPVDIDAHWIQRAMTKIYDPDVAQQKVREIMQILRVSF